MENGKLTFKKAKLNLSNVKSQMSNVSGFTLIELLITISIVAVLSAVGFTVYQSVQSKARDSIRKNDLSKLAIALELYAQQHNLTYIDDTPEEEGDCDSADTTALYTDTDFASYMSANTIPKDPQTQTNYCYISVNNGQGFRLFAKLEKCSESQGNFCTDPNFNYSITSDNLTLATAPSSIPTSTPLPSASSTSEPVPIATPTPSPTPTPIPFPAPASDDYRRVFITEANYTGNLGGLTGADNQCQIAADSADLGGTWKAWLSDAATSAKDRLTHFNSFYRLINGAAIASSWNDLVDGNLSVPISITQTGQSKAGSIKLVWTGTGTNGQLYGTVFCSNWVSESGNNPIVGNATRNNSLWTQQVANYRCNGRVQNTIYAPAALYCFEQ